MSTFLGEVSPKIIILEVYPSKTPHPPIIQLPSANSSSIKVDTFAQTCPFYSLDDTRLTALQENPLPHGLKKAFPPPEQKLRNLVPTPSCFSCHHPLSPFPEPLISLFDQQPSPQIKSTSTPPILNETPSIRRNSNSDCLDRRPLPEQTAQQKWLSLPYPVNQSFRFASSAPPNYSRLPSSRLIKKQISQSRNLNSIAHILPPPQIHTSPESEVFQKESIFSKKLTITRAKANHRNVKKPNSYWRNCGNIGPQESSKKERLVFFNLSIRRDG